MYERIRLLTLCTRETVECFGLRSKFDFATILPKILYIFLAQLVCTLCVRKSTSNGHERYIQERPLSSTRFKYLYFRNILAE